MNEFKCEKCDLLIFDDSKTCNKCNSRIVEYIWLKIASGSNEDALIKLIKKGFQIFNKKPFVERFGELDIHGFEYELQRPV
jgi:hypothetical protein